MHRKLTLRLDEAEITPRVSPKVAAQLLGLADRDASKAYFARRLHEAARAAGVAGRTPFRRSC